MSKRCKRCCLTKAAVDGVNRLCAPLFFDTSGGFALFNPDFTQVNLSLFQLLFAIDEDLFSLLFVKQVEGHMC